MFANVEDFYRLLREKQHGQIEEALKDPKNLKIAVEAYVKAGDHGMVKQLKKKYRFPSEEIAVFYAQNRDYKKAQQYAQSDFAKEVLFQEFTRLGEYGPIEEYTKQYPLPMFLLSKLIHSNQDETIGVFLSRGIASATEIAQAYQAAQRHDKVFEYVNNLNASVNPIVEEYAKRQDHERVQLYVDAFSCDPSYIARGYAIANNHLMVEAYVEKCDINLIMVSEGYRKRCNYKKAKEYLDRHCNLFAPAVRMLAMQHNVEALSSYMEHQPLREEAVKGFAEAHYHENVMDMEKKYEVSPEAIVEGYACAKNHYKVEEYQRKYKLSNQVVRTCYRRAANYKNDSSYDQPSEKGVEPSQGMFQARVFDVDLANAVTTALPTFSEGVIHGGIANKYLQGEAIPRLPKEIASSMHQGVPQAFEFTFSPLHALGKRASDYKTFPISTPFFTASLLTHCDELNLDCNWTFVCAGRKAKAQIPIPKEGRCVLVCTEEEVSEIKPFLSQNVDILVVSKLSSKTHGEYHELQTITARRLAALLCADFLNLNVVAMLDDNISKIKWNSETPPDNSWDSLLNTLSSELRGKGCVSVPTLNGHKKSVGELGSKFFMINLGLIRQKLPSSELLFLLFPEAKQADKWGEDYYFQIALHYVLMGSGIPGYEILPKENVGLLRSQQNVNAFAKTGKKAEKFADMEGLEALEPAYADLIRNTIHQLNQVIEQNYQRHAAQFQHLQNVSLFSLHARVNHTPVTDSSFRVPVRDEGNFRDNFYNAIADYDFEHEGYLRDYQMEALQTIVQQKKPLARIIMAPGSGKTLLQVLMAQFAFHAMGTGQHVFIVTPHIQLVKQFYADFLKHNARLNNGLLWVPPELILQVSSDPQSVSAGALKINHAFKDKKSIVICCEDSFKTIMADEELMKGAAIVLLDEYHDYKRTVEQLVEHIDFDKTLVVGSSATPPKHDVIKDTLYTYSLKEALNGQFHAGIVAAHFNKDFSEENLKELIQCLPGILKNQYHPGMGDDLQTLDKTKGLIYLPSIAWCEKAKGILDHHGIEAHCIHSSNPDSDRELHEFVKGKKPGVLLAVRRLRFGFDCPDLAWEIIARNPSSKEPEQDIEQMLGRIIRVQDDKIGLIMTFRDIYKKYVKPLVHQQNKALKVWSDCLAHELEYFADQEDPYIYAVSDPDVEGNVRFFSKGRKRTYSEVTEYLSDMALSDDESAMEEVEDEESQYVCTASKRRRII